MADQHDEAEHRRRPMIPSAPSLPPRSFTRRTSTLASGIPALVLLLFFVSGACSLIYEVVWTRMLVLVFGTSVWAVSTVLGAFMGGLAMGAFGFGRWIDRRRNPLRIYALLEAGIGVFALVFPLLLLWVRQAWYRRSTQAASLAILAVAGWWLVERALL